MIKINLLAEGKRPVVAREPSGPPWCSTAQLKLANWLLLVRTVVLGLLVAGGWCFMLERQDRAEGRRDRASAQKEVDELAQVIKEVEEFKAKKAELERKIEVINDLKDNQRGPVQIMDEVSKALPELLWLTEHGRRAPERINLRGHGVQHVGGRELHRQPRPGRAVQRADAPGHDARAGRGARTSVRLPADARVFVHEAVEPASRLPGRGRRRRRRDAPRRRRRPPNGRSGVTPWRSRPDSKASPGGTARSSACWSAARWSAAGYYFMAARRKYDRDRAQGPAAGRAPGQDPGRARRQAEAAAVPRRGAAPRARAREAAPDPAGAAQHAGAAAPDPAVDRAGRLRPPALHARQLHRPRLLQRVADHGAASTAPTTTWRSSSTGSAASRASSTSRTCKIAARETNRAGTRSPPASSPRRSSTREAPPPAPAPAPEGAPAVASRRGDR